MKDFQQIWVYLAASPLLHLTMTLVAYQAGVFIYRKVRLNPLFNPVLIAIGAIVAILVVTGTAYATYFEGAQFVHFLLGPATVALAVPLYRQFERVRHSGPAIFVALLAGSATAIVSAVLITWLLGAPQNVVASIAPKSATTPIAMGISEQIGGLPSLTAVVVILTGILGSMVGTGLLNRLGAGAWIDLYGLDGTVLVLATSAYPFVMLTAQANLRRVHPTRRDRVALDVAPDDDSARPRRSTVTRFGDQLVPR